MFKRSFAATKDRAGKARKVSKRSFRDDAKQRMREVLNEATTPETSPSIGGASPKLNSAIVTIVVGKDQRLFAAHEDVLSRSPWFATACRDQFFSAPGQRRISLPDDEPEVFSAVLEYLYKGDYYPRLLHDKKRNTWSLEDLQDPTMTPVRYIRTTQESSLASMSLRLPTITAQATTSSGILPSTALRFVSVCQIYSASLFASKACRLVSTWQPSCAVHVSRMRTRRPATHASEPTT